MTVDKIIIGAGLYGLYAAQKCGAAGQRVLVLERDPAPFMRATYINQARVHHGLPLPAQLLHGHQERTLLPALLPGL